jgi:hypothetical protein
MILTDITVDHRIGLDGRDRGPAVIRIGCTTTLEE